MTQKDPNYTDKNGHIVHETWDDGKLVSVEITSPSDFNNHGYYERTDYDNMGKKSYHIVKTPTPKGYDVIEERFDKKPLPEKKKIPFTLKWESKNR